MSFMKGDPGVRFGIDVGTVRVGVAASDPEGIMAFPVATLNRDTSVVENLCTLMRERDAVMAYVGLPRHLAGHEGESARDARTFAQALVEHCGIPVRLVDERMSSVAAHAALREAGVATRDHRTRVDQQAAVTILDTAMNAEKAGHADNVTQNVRPKGSDA